MDKDALADRLRKDQWRALIFIRAKNDSAIHDARAAIEIRSRDHRTVSAGIDARRVRLKMVVAIGRIHKRRISVEVAIAARLRRRAGVQEINAMVVAIEDGAIVHYDAVD